MAKVIDFSDSDIEQSKKITKLPNFLKLLFFVEMWERFISNFSNIPIRF